ncbi:MAG: ROK family protein [Opitutales bacterium]|jgi:glucokinase|nr:ROK family protein [Opitutales bacterium]
MTWSVGIDIGGTAIKAVAINDRDEIILQRSKPTNDDPDSFRTWVDSAKAILSELESEVGSPANAVGICAPGLADRQHRWISYLPVKLQGIEKFDWTQALGCTDQVPVVNDAHSALLGESWIGAAGGKQDVVLLTLGTGVGGAILSDGRLINGAIGRAGHLGHMSQDIVGEPSIANMPGAIETMIGNSTVEKRSDGKFYSTRDLVKAHEGGDTVATEVWLKSIRALGCAIASYINILDPEVVVLTGGITTAGDSLINPLLTVMEEVEWRPGGHTVPIIFGKLDMWAGAVGAAYAALHPDKI